MTEQMSLFPDSENIYIQVGEHRKQKRMKRRWENAFQKWSNEQSHDGTEPYGCCGYGGLCDWCEDPSFGRPCVRSLNEMCREKKIRIDYTDYDFKKIWFM